VCQHGYWCGVVAECSKEAYADGITGAVNAYWNWQSSVLVGARGSGSGSRGSNGKAATTNAAINLARWRNHPPPSAQLGRRQAWSRP